jgi:hypothetical protein
MRVWDAQSVLPPRWAGRCGAQARLAKRDVPRPQPKAAMPAPFASADIAVVTLKSDIPGAVPSKLYRPWRAACPSCSWRPASGRDPGFGEGGFHPVKPGDIDGLAAALGRLSRSKEKRASLGSAGRVAAVEGFDRRPLCDQFIEVLGGA